MSASGELADSRTFELWWREQTATTRPSRPHADEMAEWVALSGLFPKRTKVIVTPALGAPWLGVVEEWTGPGSGRLMAVVRPSQGRGEREPMHVAPRFLTAVPLAVQLAGQGE